VEPIQQQQTTEHLGEDTRYSKTAESKEELLRGFFRVLLLYDVAEALDLPQIREMVGPRGGSVERGFPRRTPEYVRFEEAPIIESAGPITIPATGEKLSCYVKYYAYAVVIVQVDVPFECDWLTLLYQTSRWMDATEIEAQAREIVRDRLERVAPAVVRRNTDLLHEGYLVINLHDVLNTRENPPSAAALLSERGDQIVQLIRGELSPLAPKVRDEIVQSGLSYYPSDLVVVGSSAAFVYDRPEDASSTNQVLEYAKMQLLEFRYYDGLMTRALSSVYDALERTRNVLLSRWKLPREANRLNTIRLDVMELTERIDNAIKFISDAYFAQVYRLAAKRMGVPDYRELVDEKLRTVGDLYDFMVDQFNQARSFVLELGIAILLTLDVILLFKGK
jgi:hypothetical protein